MSMNRRGFLGAMLGVMAAPAVVKAANLMKIVVPKKDIILDGDFCIESWMRFGKTSEDGIILPEGKAVALRRHVMDDEVSRMYPYETKVFNIEPNKLEYQKNLINAVRISLPPETPPAFASQLVEHYMDEYRRNMKHIPKRWPA